MIFCNLDMISSNFKRQCKLWGLTLAHSCSPKSSQDYRGSIQKRTRSCQEANQAGVACTLHVAEMGTGGSPSLLEHTPCSPAMTVSAAALHSAMSIYQVKPLQSISA